MLSDAMVKTLLPAVMTIYPALAVSDNRPGHPVSAPNSSDMLVGDWFDHPHAIDFDKLPRVPSEHVVISDVTAANGVNQHNYLVHYDDRFWAMWSDGPAIEDRVGQVVKYATSDDGRSWSEPKSLTGYPPGSGPDSPHYGTRHHEGFRYIARVCWVRDSELLALISLDEAADFFGPSLTLLAYRWDPDKGTWNEYGVVYRNAINNFAPKRLPTGEWMMSRRPYNYGSAGVDFLIGGVDAFDRWKAFPVPKGPLAAEEPCWWTLPDGNLTALFRDNRASGYIYRSFSVDNGRTWTRPVRTDFPDARSKFHGVRMRDGRYVLVSNSHPKRRDPLTLAISDDGVVFNRLYYLVGGRRNGVDYPMVMEHEGYLYVAHSGGYGGRKQSVELQRVRIADLGKLDMVDARTVRFVLREESPPAAAVDYLNLDKAEMSRQRAFARSGVQEIAPVLLPDEGLADGARSEAFGWPHAGIVDDVLIVHFRVRGGLIRSTDGGRTWEDPVFTDCGILVLGTTDSGKVVAVSVNSRRPNTLDVLISQDKGKSWQRHQSQVATPADLTARVVAHPRFGLIAGGHPERDQLVFLVSQDEGLSWRRVAFPLPGFYTDGTVPFAWGDQLGVFARCHHGGSDWSTFAQCYPTNIETAKRIEELEWRWTPNNIFVAKMDTPDAVYNPVSGRIEAVTTKRDAGFPYRDSGLKSGSVGYMTLNLWSIDPNEFLDGRTDWRFEGVLLRSKGEKARIQNPRDGMHPSGTVVDEKNGVQHIFIYGGDRAHGEGAPETGKTGVFRITRTLDTKRWRAMAAELGNYGTILRFDEEFESLERWVPSGSPTGQLEFSRTEPPRRVGDAPLPEGGRIALDGEGRLCIQTGASGYHGLHNEDVVVTPDYRFEFKVRVRAYADRGEVLGVNVNCGPRKFHLILRKDGIYDWEAPQRARQIREMPMDNDWHIWVVEMRGGKARVCRDGEFVGIGTPMIDPAVGSRPISIYSNPDGGSGSKTDVQMDYFRFENL